MTRFVVEFEGDITINKTGGVQHIEDAAGVADNTYDYTGENSIRIADISTSKSDWTDPPWKPVSKQINAAVVFNRNHITANIADTATGTSGEVIGGEIDVLSGELELAGPARQATSRQRAHLSAISTTSTSTFWTTGKR